MPRTAPTSNNHRVTATDAINAGTFSLNIHPGREDWYAVEEWMVAEGWDPGFGDTQAVTTLDRRALVIGMLDDEPISALSLLRLNEQYAFCGNYVVREDYRGRGFGLATCRAALPHAGSRVIGLEAVPEQLETYRRVGFTASHTTISYQGIIPRGSRPNDRRIREFEPDDFEPMIALDALSSPHERSEFLAAWMAATATLTLVYDDGCAVTGFGMIRPSRTGVRIGPLIADTPATALALYDALTAACPGELVWLNCPEPNVAGADLARRRGLLRASHTVRMYSHPVRPTALSSCYSIASPAWG
jgi:GNAT superfamily N-acetyltransferase